MLCPSHSMSQLEEAPALNTKIKHSEMLTAKLRNQTTVKHFFYVGGGG